MTQSATRSAKLDHVMLAGPDLDEMIEDIEQRTGVRPALGGVHDGLGTHNALLDLGESRYLELLAPLPRAENRSPFSAQVAAMRAPSLRMWAVRVTNLDRMVERCAADGLDMGQITEMSRTPPGEPAQHWKLTVGGADVWASVLPFAIEWKTSAHPSDGLTPGCRLLSLGAGHPEPDRMRRALSTLGISIPIRAAERPELVLEIDSPAGRIEIR